MLSNTINNKNVKKHPIYYQITLLILFLLSFSLSGCVLLVVPGAALLGHTIQKSNEEYDELIVNYGLKYKKYYSEMTEVNNAREKNAEEPEGILSFSEWLETQAKTEKERKAVVRYKRINSSGQ